jgi:putative oxidoreductase
MTRALTAAAPPHALRALDVVRVAVALIQVVHPLHGLWSGGRWGADVTGFGLYLGSLGLPFGVALAWGVILTQLLACVALLARRLVVPACLALMGILASGIALLHVHEGWFVVGAGRNGMEFSALLIACLAAVLVSERGPRLRPLPSP